MPRSLARRWFALGAAPLALLLVQVVSGVALALHYVPSNEGAHESVRQLTEAVPFGWYLRSLHRWAAVLLVLTALLHVLRVFLDGAYRRPRGLGWLTGGVLLSLVLLTSFTGELLTGSASSHWAAVMARSFAEAIPLVGAGLGGLLLGPGLAGAALPRVHLWHVLLLPGAMALLVVGHLGLVHRHGLADASVAGQEHGGTDRRLMPDQLRVDALVALGLLGALQALTLLSPVPCEPPADPMTTPAGLQPAWYLLPAVRWLEIAPRQLGVASLLGAGLLFLLWPWADARVVRGAHGRAAVRWLGAAMVLGMVGLALWRALGGDP